MRQALDGEQLRKQVGLESSTLPPQAKMKDLTEDEIRVLSTLWSEGHKGLYHYIVHSMWEKDWGKQNPPHKRPTCIQNRQRNKCWFNLGLLKTPGLFGAKGYWDRTLYPLNPERVVIDCRLLLLAGVLNSSLARLFREMHCRITGGGMGEMMVYEMKDMPILDTRALTYVEKDRIRDAFRKLAEKDEITSEELNRAVLAPLGLEDQSSGFGALVDSISEARRKGKQANLMIEGLDGVFKKVGKLKGADVVSRSRQSHLSEF